VAADDRSILPPREDRRDEAELAEAALERVELVLADPSWVGRVRAEIVDGDLLDREGGEARGDAHALRSPDVASRGFVRLIRRKGPGR
jgi:hypothetical protein